ncbi:MAG: hypothetical protein AAF921_02970 [Cyanobacteria bacterium P01_D01_bin.44]
MTNFLDIFGHQLGQAQKQFEDLVQQIKQTHDPSELLARARENLSTALEEVNVLLEELTVQHGPLATQICRSSPTQNQH